MYKEKILEFFRKHPDKAISGRQVAEKLGFSMRITHGAIWSLKRENKIEVDHLGTEDTSKRRVGFYKLKRNNMVDADMQKYQNFQEVKDLKKENEIYRKIIRDLIKG